MSAFFLSRKWKRIEHTLTEAQAISKALSPLPTYVFTGKDATKHQVKALNVPCVLHIATHGFYIEDAILKTAYPSKITEQDLLGFDAPSPEEIVHVSFSPLVRAGLVFAGANMLPRSPITGLVDNGILTALETSSLNLHGTELVVLSACETGLGVEQYGDTVMGLRRAFQIAGAQTIVMSLWSIPDRETMSLMTEFYTQLRGGIGRSEALRRASLTLMNERRNSRGAAHPYFWAAFICVGNPSAFGLKSNFLELKVDKVTNYMEVNGSSFTIYSSAGTHDDCQVFGRGQKVTVSLLNRSPYCINITGLNLRVLEPQRDYNQELRYDKTQLAILHTSPPIGNLCPPIHLKDGNPTVSSLVGIGRGFDLEASGHSDSEHQIDYVVKAMSPGLYIYQLEAQFINPITQKNETIVFANKFMVLLRGT